MERMVRECITTQDTDGITPQFLINIKPVTVAVKEFLGSSQLSQLMGQNNPLVEPTHKRHLSALGPGGLSGDRAGLEARDVHHIHYGRMYPIGAPEGPSTDLTNFLATYVRVNQYGPTETPCHVVDKTTDPANPKATDEVVYLTADEEDDFVVAQVNEALDEEDCLVHNNILGRLRTETSEFQKKTVGLMDVSPRMVFSVIMAIILSLENDDANRVLMGPSIQRQVMLFLTTEAPTVGTGTEVKVAADSGVCVVTKNVGVVECSASNEAIIRRDSDSNRDMYHLTKFKGNSQSNCYNQKPIAYKNSHVEVSEVIVDGPSTSSGEIALRKDPFIGFMIWKDYSYEDTVLLSERLIQEDVYISTRIEGCEVEACDTKPGPEEIARDVSGVGEDTLEDLDGRDIIRTGAEVRAGDILVGKITPKGETELTAEGRLLCAIFGEEARETRDTFFRVPYGTHDITVDTKVFTRENRDELSSGMNQTIRTYTTQKRKISMSNKMTGRHGNKSVISHVLPTEDMPLLPNRRLLDIVLNPLGVPFRMNIGQALEIHLSLVAKVLDFDVSTPIPGDANENDIIDTLEMTNDYVNASWDGFKAKYKGLLKPFVADCLGAHLEHRELWKGMPISRDDKIRLRDGHIGEYSGGAVIIRHTHYLKLHHLVDNKIHARSTGPYSLIAQQLLGDKAQFGGQRLGEVEAWTLEAYGASYTLQEVTTAKFNDAADRTKTYEVITEGENTPEPGVPEPPKVLLKEMRSLGPDVQVLRDDGVEVEMNENIDYGDTGLRAMLEGGRRSEEKESYTQFDCQEQEFKDSELVAAKKGEDVSADDCTEEAGDEDDLLSDEAAGGKDEEQKGVNAHARD